MNSVSVLFELPVTASDFTSDVTIIHYRGQTALHFEYYDGEEEKEYRLILHDTYTFRFSTDVCCTTFQIENAYEQMVELAKSEWIESIYALSNVNEIPIAKNLKHFMIYLPDFGMCEFAALKVSQASVRM
jgi:hypothetical protein